MTSAHRFRSIYRTPVPRIYKLEEPSQPYQFDEGQPSYADSYPDPNEYEQQQYQINSQNHLLEPVQPQSSVNYQQRNKPIQQQNHYEPPHPTFVASSSKRKKGESKKKAIQKDLDRIFNF